MRETHRNNYVPGTKWKECPKCGFDFLEKDMVVNHDGKLVCLKDFDELSHRDHMKERNPDDGSFDSRASDPIQS